MHTYNSVRVRFLSSIPQYALAAREFSAGFILGIEPPERHTMFEFNTLEDIDQFEINTDRVMGGACRSRAETYLLPHKTL